MRGAVGIYARGYACKGHLYSKDQRATYVRGDASFIAQRSGGLTKWFCSQKFSKNKKSVGIPVLALGVAMGTGLAWCKIGTNEPTFGKDQSCSLGRIAGRVPMS